MKTIRRLSVRTKLAITMLLMALVFVAAGVVAIWQLDTVSNAIEDIVDQTATQRAAVQELIFSLEAYRAAEAEYLITGGTDVYWRVLDAQEVIRQAAVTVREGLSEAEAVDWFDASFTVPLEDLIRLSGIAAGLRWEDQADAAMAMFPEVSAAVDGLLAVTDELVAQYETERHQIENDLLRKAADTRAVATGILVVSLVLAGVFIFAVPSQITRPVRALANASMQMAEGDLTVEPLPVVWDDELGQMTRIFNGMVETLRNVASDVAAASDELVRSSDEITGTAEEVASATQELAAAIEQVASGTMEQSNATDQAMDSLQELQRAAARIADSARNQASRLERTAQIVGSIEAAVDNVLRHASEIAEAAALSMETASTGGDVVQQSVLAMQHISRVTTDTAEKIGQLGRHSARVGEIVNVISDIAEQTNLLALNAAIEAARAGEHGRGFAVVADEVRQLAERSAQSAREIADLVVTIQSETANAVAAMETNRDEANKGLDLSHQAGEALQRILGAFEGLNGQIQTVREVTQELGSAIGDVTKNVREIAGIAEENVTESVDMLRQSEEAVIAMERIASTAGQTAATAEEMAASTKEAASTGKEMEQAAKCLSEMAERLRTSVAGFRL